MSQSDPEAPIPIGLFSVVSIIELRIKRLRRPWRIVRAMAWRPEALKAFLQKMLEGRNK